MSKTTYQKAFDELQEIVSKLQSEEIGLDDLSNSVKRASTLIKTCKEKLRNVELEIDDMLKEE